MYWSTSSLYTNVGCHCVLDTGKVLKSSVDAAFSCFEFIMVVGILVLISVAIVREKFIKIFILACYSPVLCYSIHPCSTLSWKLTRIVPSGKPGENVLVQAMFTGFGPRFPIKNWRTKGWRHPPHDPQTDALLQQTKQIYQRCKCCVPANPSSSQQTCHLWR